ncbi:hypothetical protein [Brevibacillus daliensis]|uniref:hypothetical protein n=1 Tax=Brevibacillus daliensis TaxID=2892995 RepID=UPI001E56A4B1|nr:hypothetical protein [Brevibacillus daliensis]
MAKSFSVELDGLKRAIRKSPIAVSRAIHTSLNDVKDDWTKQSVDISPIDTSNLRKQISGEIDGSQLVMTANATRGDGGRFNYAYHIHELDAGGKSLKSPGAEKKFLDKPAEDSETKWRGWMNDQVQLELRKSGW